MILSPQFPIIRFSPSIGSTLYHSAPLPPPPPLLRSSHSLAFAPAAPSVTRLAHSNAADCLWCPDSWWVGIRMSDVCLDALKLGCVNIALLARWGLTIIDQIISLIYGYCRDCRKCRSQVAELAVHLKREQECRITQHRAYLFDQPCTWSRSTSC